MLQIVGIAVLLKYLPDFCPIQLLIWSTDQTIYQHVKSSSVAI